MPVPRNSASRAVSRETTFRERTHSRKTIPRNRLASQPSERVATADLLAWEAGAASYKPDSNAMSSCARMQVRITESMRAECIGAKSTFATEPIVVAGRRFWTDCLRLDGELFRRARAGAACSGLNARDHFPQRDKILPQAPGAPHEHSGCAANHTSDCEMPRHLDTLLRVCRMQPCSRPAGSTLARTRQFRASITPSRPAQIRKVVRLRHEVSTLPAPQLPSGRCMRFNNGAVVVHAH